MQAATHQGEVEPFYFGPAESPLFGCYHPATGPAVGSWGVVLCPPIGREYSRSHRTFRQLATRLASAGFPVLRFDFSGCGDSSGEFEDAHPQRWLEDIAVATDALKRKCSPARICLVGLRLGATLALVSSARQGDVGSLVLWEPFVTGQGFLDDLAASHREYMHRPPVAYPPVGGGQSHTEMLGLSFSDAAIAALGQLDAASMRRRPADDVLLVTGDEAGEAGTLLAQHLHSLGVRVRSSRLPSPEVWRNDQHALVPGKTLHAVVSWINEVCQ